MLSFLFVCLSFGFGTTTAYAQGTNDIDPNATYIIQNVKSGKVLDVKGGSTADGANIIQWTQHGRENQQFKIEQISNGAFIITNVKSGKALDVKGGSTADGANIIQWTRHGRENQQFRFRKTSEGNYLIKNVKSDKLLDVKGGSMDDGANVLQWTQHGRENQQFRLVKVNSNKPATATLKIGDRHAGGIIFYLDGNGGGLVCSESDQNSHSNQKSARHLCDNIVLNGYDDWYLPSKDEIGSISDALLQSLNFDKNGTTFYWTSTEGFAFVVYTHEDHGFDMVATDRNNYVRAIREFSENDASVQESSLKIGDVHAGGYVFYLDGFGGGLVLAPSDQSAAVPLDGNCSSTLFGEYDNRETMLFGMGQSNTKKIAANCSQSGAARMCDDLVLNGYDDWYLPSFYEFVKMNPVVRSRPGFVSAPCQYWLSGDMGLAFTMYGTCCDADGGDDGDGDLRVCAIRAFSKNDQVSTTQPPSTHTRPTRGRGRGRN